MVQAIANAVANLNSPAIDYVNLTKVFNDVEDGGNLTFEVANTHPAVAKVTVQASGMLTLAFAPDTAGMTDVTVKATDSAGNYTQVSFAVHVVDPDQGNVAFMKPTTVSSLESDTYAASFANDGDLNTRWSTKYEDNHWLHIDLGGTFLINQVVLKWEAAYGKAYELQISEDGEQWTTIFNKQYGDGETDDILFEAVPASYVRMLGLQRGT